MKYEYWKHAHYTPTDYALLKEFTKVKFIHLIDRNDRL